jgi:hypothetical protein
VPPNFVVFLFTMNQFDWPITQKNETIEAPQDRRLLYLWLHIQNQPNIFDNFVFFFSPPPPSLLGDFIVSEGHRYPLFIISVVLSACGGRPFHPSSFPSICPVVIRRHGTDLWQLNYKSGKEWPSKTLQRLDSRRLFSCNENVFRCQSISFLHYI